MKIPKEHLNNEEELTLSYNELKKVSGGGPQAPSSSSGVNSGLEIHSPIPGIVKAIVVVPGQNVFRGDSVVILDAMKMEIPICTSADGTVESILVKVGEKISTNQLICTMK